MEWAWLAVGAAALLTGLFAGWLLAGRGAAEARARAEAELAAVRATADQRQEALGRALAEMAHYKARVEELKPEADRAPGLAAKVAALEATQAERDAAHGRQLAAMREEFARTAGEALERAQAAFAAQAGETLKAHREATERNLEVGKAALGDLIKPVSDTLERYQTNLKDMEAKRETAYGGLQQALAQVAQGQLAVRDEAAKLANALRTSGKAAGRWGEAQLRNVLAMAGLQEGLDFDLQASVATDDGALRPDAVIKLPGGRCLVVDAKCSMGDFLAAAEAGDDAERSRRLTAHARAIRSHADGLTRKAYWEQFAGSADFVVMFVAGESALAAALAEDRALMDWAFERRVVLAAPINLIALAKTVAAVRSQEKLASEARALGQLATQLYDALRAMAGHVQSVGLNLERSVGAYNKMLGSLDLNVLPKARQFPKMGIAKTTDEIPELRVIEAVANAPRSPEMLAAPDKAA